MCVAPPPEPADNLDAPAPEPPPLYPPAHAVDPQLDNPWPPTTI